MATHRDAEQLLAALARSRFRGRFRLGPRETAYLADKGLDVIMQHARDLLARRLFPALIANDGRQTPMRGHPVFVAQHATATCCRQCLATWHGIAAGHTLEPAEQAHVLGIIRTWLAQQTDTTGTTTRRDEGERTEQS